MAKDVCNVLGISKYRDAITDLNADERISINVDTLAGSDEVSRRTERSMSYGSSDNTIIACIL